MFEETPTLATSHGEICELLVPSADLTETLTLRSRRVCIQYSQPGSADWVRVRQQDKGGAAWVLILLMTTNEQQCKGEEQDFSPEFVMRDEHGIQAPRVFKRSRGSLRGDLMDIHATPTIGLGIIKPKLLVDVPPAARVSSFRYMTAKCGTNVAPRPLTLSSNDNTELKQSKQPVAECQDNGQFE